MTADEFPIWTPAPRGANDCIRELRFTYQFPGESTERTAYRNVTVPTLTVFRPQRPIADGAAVIICPGGGFRYLAWDYEGTELAVWLADQGVTAFVLKYRLHPTPEDLAAAILESKDVTRRMKADFRSGVAELDGPRRTAIEDGRQAIRILRARATEWRIDPARLGILGFSAGAALAVGVARSADQASRPNFAVVLYGFDYDETALCNEAPPLFVAATRTDEEVPVIESVRIFERWIAAGRSAEIHVFDQGAHGFGVRKLGLPVDGWPSLLMSWLEQLRTVPLPIQD